ncbi:DNA mismatch repair protein Msh3 [Blattella germanica]|nr:DNA mismatch repair protein Msh3 [Blattella germanica]
MAFDPSTGETVYDSFEDGSCREGLEQRLEHLSPAEIITSSSLSDRTECILKFSSARLERLSDDEFNFSNAFLHVSSFFREQDSSELGSGNSLYDFPPSVLVCLSVLIRHLKEFGLDKGMRHQGFRNFTSDSKHLQMDASALRNLEIFETSVGSYKGSLMWALNHTKTKFGSRLLREWLSQPLRDLGTIQSRQEAITELCNSDSGFVCQLRELLSGMPDIDRGLTTCLHQRCGPATFYAILQSLMKLHSDFQNMWSTKEGELTSPLLQCLVRETIDLLAYVRQFLQNINEKAAREGDKTQLLNDYSDFPSVVKRLDEISEINKKLDSLKPNLARRLSLMKFDYVTVADQKFLIEVKHNQKINVPNQWRKVSETKQVVRYRSPEIDALAKELSRLQEKLVVECHSAWLAFLDDFNVHYFSHKKAVKNVATLDVLSSLAHVAMQDGFCKPLMVDSDETVINIENGRHPVTPLLFSSDDQFVANNTNLQSNSQSCMILSGPNMGGKSCYIRQVALLAVMAHIGSYIPADSATISLLDCIFTRMGARDNLFKGRSTFMLELEEVSTILHKASSRSLVLLDELGRGTSSCDGTAIAIAVLHSLLTEIKCLTLFVTHYPAVMEMEQQYSGKAKNYHMAFLVHDEDESPEVLTFLYKVTSGPTSHSYGLNVARLAGIPTQILKKAAEKSEALEMCANSKKSLWQKFRNIWSSCQSIEGL